MSEQKFKAQKLPKNYFEGSNKILNIITKHF